MQVSARQMEEQFERFCETYPQLDGDACMAEALQKFAFDDSLNFWTEALKIARETVNVR